MTGSVGAAEGRFLSFSLSVRPSLRPIPAVRSAGNEQRHLPAKPRHCRPRRVPRSIPGEPRVCQLRENQQPEQLCLLNRLHWPILINVPSVLFPPGLLQIEKLASLPMPLQRCWVMLCGAGDWGRGKCCHVGYKYMWGWQKSDPPDPQRYSCT